MRTLKEQVVLPTLMKKGAHLVEAHAGEDARAVGVSEGAAQRVQRRHVACPPKAQHAQLAHLQQRAGAAKGMSRLCLTPT